jgi:hypothetical protein
MEFQCQHYDKLSPKKKDHQNINSDGYIGYVEFDPTNATGIDSEKPCALAGRIEQVNLYKDWQQSPYIINRVCLRCCRTIFGELILQEIHS